MSPHQAPVDNSQYVADALSAAHALYLSHNPTSAKVHNAATAHLPGGNTRTSMHTEPFPLAIKSGSGNSITSVDGRTYIDFLGEYSAGLFGHSHPRIAEAITDAVKSGWNYGAESLLEKEFARKVTSRFGPGGIDLVRFTNSGTEANTMAIGAAITWTGRKKVLVFSNAYHGGTLIFPLSLCRWSHEGAQGPPPFTTVNLPHEFVMAPYNNISETANICAKLPRESLAAIIVEGVQGSGGCRPAAPGFLKFLRSTADDLGALLIIDEVMTSRLSPSGHTATLGIKADLMTLGKWVGGGMTFGAFGGRADIMGMFDPDNHGPKGVMHPGTYNNNVFTMRAGIAALDIFDEEKIKDLNARGDRLKDGITDLLFEYGIYKKDFSAHLKDAIEVDSFEDGAGLYAGENKTLPLPKVLITGKGSMLNLRFTGLQSGLWHNLYFHFMLEKGIYMAGRGFTPLNLAITDENVLLFLGAVREFLITHLDELTE